VKGTLYSNEVLFEMNCVATEYCCQQCWTELADTELCFPVSLLAGDRPEMWQLQRFVGVGGRPVKVVENVCADWEKLALALQFRGGVIRAVRESERPLVEPACRRILERWSVNGEGRQPVTWETLVECLDDIGHCTLASDLRRELEP